MQVQTNAQMQMTIRMRIQMQIQGLGKGYTQLNERTHVNVATKLHRYATFTYKYTCNAHTAIGIDVSTAWIQTHMQVQGQHTHI